MIKKSSAHTRNLDAKPTYPSQLAVITFDETCSVCDKDVPNGRLVLRHDITQNIICLECIVEIAKIE